MNESAYFSKVFTPVYRTSSIAIVRELKRGSLKAFKTKTSLLSAVRYSSKEVVEALREDKDERETDERGASLLMVALDEGNIDTAELFLNDKAFQLVVFDTRVF